ncbi:ligase-associated DNA damage response endonuclease PdeM [Lacinutrix chionoecetis]
MNIVTKDITCKGEIFTLTNQRVLFWKSENTLILSDLHIGKSAHFRKHGIPISKQVLQKDLERLEAVIMHFKPETILVVGDLFHAEFNSDIETFKIWLQRFHHINFELIIGNHDRLSGDLYMDLNIKIFRPNKTIANIRFEHDNVVSTRDIFTISGHTHPGVIIRGKARQRIKLPCFQVTENQLILPAFSLFTGLNTKNCPDKCVNYAFTTTQIFKI